MKIMRRVLWSLLGIVALFMIIGLFLPSQIHVERSIDLNVDNIQVFDMLNNPTNFEQWSPWHGKDMAMKVVYFEPLYGKGAGFEWKSDMDDVGSGRYFISKSVPGQLVEIDLDFGEMGTSKSSHIITSVGTGTKMVWTMDTDMGPWPPMRWMGLMMDVMIGADYEKGLAKFKEVIEKAPTARIVSITEQMFPGVTAYTVKQTINPRVIGETMGASYGSIMQYIEASKATMVGAPFAIYHSWSPSKTEIECGIPVATASAGTNTIAVASLPAGPVVAAEFSGPYDRSEMAHIEIAKWAVKNGKKLDNTPWEVYVTDPGSEPDASKWITQVYYRILQ